MYKRQLTTNTFTRTDYTFSGWNTAASGSGTAYADGATYAFSADVTLYAQWMAPAPTVTSILPTRGSIYGGSSVTITGTGFLSGATVTIGSAATNVIVVSDTSITATTAAGTAGATDVVVTNTDLQTGTLPGGFTYVVPTWVFESTYPGRPVSYWKYTVIGQETLPSGTGAGETLGGPCDKIEVDVYSDAACTTPMQPKRTATVTITILSPMYDWRGVNDRQLRQRYNQASALSSIVTNWLYYRVYTPDPGFGAPYEFGEGWTFTEQIDSSNPIGDKTTEGITAAIAGATEAVTTPAGTFTCYKLTIAQVVSGTTKYIYEYWDASGANPYTPVKVVDSVNFGSTDTRVLSSSNIYP